VRLTLAMVVLGCAAMLFGAEATSSGKMSLDISKAEPRQVEEATQQAIVRDYGKAWQNMSAALEQNRADLLAASFTGFAKDKLTQAIDEQKKNGLKRKYIDRGHKLQVVFYSVEGSAMELRDTAQVEIQLMDGSKVVHSEQATVNYVVLLTPTENSWKVRMLEAAPEAGR
jgi:hypothetical protein